MSGLRKTSPRYVRCWLYPSGSELLPSKVMSVRVIFFWRKTSPPLPNGSLLEGYRCWWQFRRERFPSFYWPSRGSLFTGEATCADLVFWKKNVSPLGCCLEGLFSSLYLLRWGRMMDAEGSDRKMSPPFLDSIFRFFRGYL